ncbi:MAG: ATP-dependent DNA helicase DinG [Gammaproteobacteria bacterium]|nr:ATP-dependent DNA helicase DinG [Gammaproteobacteria bacterium]MBT5204054.1 ATP-dependent DNA helicase DinG [Gammaproteobacteria bacterium]MBT5604080.1 ATP-dependent DNA helicase DinG [Gammaproteobacteria bacterium]MBT6244848.1 ATP-dependent DNA helicase DinG [Gammaproteobacteria bacterium]
MKLLNDSLKEEIQEGYSQFLSSKGFTARYCQRLMIAEVARQLSEAWDEDAETYPLGLIEAPTGTGKTVAYVIGALPVAKRRGKRLVISTATIALQEQLVFRDIPDIRANSDMDFSWALAKGRRRYVCLSRLDALLQVGVSGNQALAFFEDEFANPDAEDLADYQEMLGKLAAGDWNGDRDSYPDTIADPSWRKISTDRSQCTHRQCSFFRNCAFYRAREELVDADVIVTNHDLLLADVSGGGGNVLPEPSDCLLVLDEAHHLTEKARSQFSAVASVNMAMTHLESARSLSQQLEIALKAVDLLDQIPGSSQLDRLSDNSMHASTQLAELRMLLMQFFEKAIPDGRQHRFRLPCGEVDAELIEQGRSMERIYTGIIQALELWQSDLERAMTGADLSQRTVLENWIPNLGGLIARLDQARRLWELFTREEPVDLPPRARWIDYSEDDLVVHCSPISVAETLATSMWGAFEGVIMTSATLSVGGDFSLIRDELGLPEMVRRVSLPSPFDYATQGCLRIPKMRSDPGNPDAHNEEIAQLIPELLVEKKSGLVLFTSWRQMQFVIGELDASFRSLIICQGELTKSHMLDQHRQRIDSGTQSYLFGLASFAEGVDLPGDYCCQVIIAKIPFTVPDDPVGATLYEWIDAKGGNSFAQVMVPTAALRLTQAAGRLLRTEQDSGIVTILDSRLRSRRYGPNLIAALPPFKLLSP